MHLDIKRQSHAKLCAATEPFLETCTECLPFPLLSRGFCHQSMSKNRRITMVTNTVGLKDSWHWVALGISTLEDTWVSVQGCLLPGKENWVPMAPVNYRTPCGFRQDYPVFCLLRNCYSHEMPLFFSLGIEQQFHRGYHNGTEHLYVHLYSAEHGKCSWCGVLYWPESEPSSSTASC